jgi:hypothetical protein
MVLIMRDEKTMPPNEYDGLQRQIDQIGKGMEKGFDELKEILSGFDKRVRDVEIKEANCNPVLTSKVDAAWRKLGEHDSKLTVLDASIGELKKSISELTHTNKILKWILGILTGLLTVYLAKILVGG